MKFTLRDFFILFAKRLFDFILLGNIVFWAGFEIVFFGEDRNYLFVITFIIWIVGGLSTLGIVFRKKELSQKQGFLEFWKGSFLYITGYFGRVPKEQEGMEPPPRKKLKVKRYLIAGSVLLVMVIGVILIIQQYLPSEKPQKVENTQKRRYIYYRDYDKEKATSYWKLGYAYYNQESYAQAATAFEETVGYDYFNVTHRLWLGHTYCKLKLYDEAIAQFEIGIELDPDNPLPHNGLGNVYYYKGLYDKAIIEYKAAIELKPYKTYERIIHGNLALAYLAQGRYPEAVIEYEVAIKLLGDDNEYKKLLKKLESAGGKPPIISMPLPPSGLTQDLLNRMHASGLSDDIIIQELRRMRQDIANKYYSWQRKWLEASQMLDEIIKMDAYRKATCLEVSIPTEDKDSQNRD